MAIDYLQLLRNLVEEHESWVRKRDDAERELSRLSELIRSTIRMLSDEQRAECGCEILLERLDNSPRGLTTAIRGAFTADKEWLTPVEVRDYLKEIGFNFEAYKANPLASIHTTLRRMIPHEMECKITDGRKRYRLKTAEQWRSSFNEALQWLTQSGVDWKQDTGRVATVKRRSGELESSAKRRLRGEKHGNTGSS